MLSFRHGADKARVRLSICDQLRHMRDQGKRQALHMQQPLPRHEDAPPDVALGHMQGSPQRLHLLAPVPELLPIQLAIQPAMEKVYCLNATRECDAARFCQELALKKDSATKAQIPHKDCHCCRSML